MIILYVSCCGVRIEFGGDRLTLLHARVGDFKLFALLLEQRGQLAADPTALAKEEKTLCVTERGRKDK